MGADPTNPREIGGVAQLGEIASAAGLRRIAILAWRDIDDPEAGGSELHASPRSGVRPASK
jgi:hypothetical protein